MLVDVIPRITEAVYSLARGCIVYVIRRIFDYELNSKIEIQERRKLMGKHSGALARLETLKVGWRRKGKDT